MLKFFKWFVSRIRITLLWPLVATILSVIVLLTGVISIALIASLVPALIVALFIFAIYVIVGSWLRTETPEWQKALMVELEKIKGRGW